MPPRKKVNPVEKSNQAALDSSKNLTPAATADIQETPACAASAIATVCPTPAGDVQPAPATEICSGQASGITLLDALAIGLLQERTGNFDHDNPAFADRVRQAYRRATVMAEVRKEFV